MTTGTAKFIKVKVIDSGEILDFAIQQYAVGLYVCINQDGRLVDQFGTNMSQEKFIEKLKNDENFEIMES